MSDPGSTKQSVAERVSKVIELLGAGENRQTILQYASKTGNFAEREGEPWGVSDRSVDEYLKKAYAEFEVKDETGRKREIKKAHMRFSRVYHRAMQQDNLKAAVSAERARCDLLGLNTPAKMEHSGSVILSWKDLMEKADGSDKQE